MLLKKLTIRNFMSIQSAVVELNGQGLVLVSGENEDSAEFESNGSGKSSIFEALSVVLYEKSIRGLSMKEVVNEEVGKNLVLWLEMETEDGINYRIERYRDHVDMKNSTVVLREGKNVTPKSSKDVNKFIEDLIQLDFMTFTNSILFGGGLIKTFTVASDAERKLLLDKMLSLDVWSSCLDVAKKRLKKVVSDKTSASNVLSSTQGLVDEYEESIKSLKEEKRNEKAEREKTIKELQKEYKKADKDYKFKLNRAEEEKQELENQIESLNKEIEDLNESKNKFKSLKERLDKKLETFNEAEELKEEAQKKANDLDVTIRLNQSRLDDVVARIKKIQEGVGSTCPTCDSEITSDSIKLAVEEHKKDMKKHLKAVGGMGKQLREQNGIIADQKQILSKKNKVLEQKSKVSGEYSSIVSFIKRELTNLSKLKREIESKNETIEEIQENKESKRILTQLENEKNRVSSYDNLISKTKDKLENAKKKIEETTEKIESHREEEQKIQFAVESFGNSGIKSYLLDSVTPYLNEKANYYMSKLAGNTTEIEFSTQTTLASGETRDKFDVVITNSVGGSSYKSNSTGERRRVDIAIALALQDLIMSRSNTKMNVLLYDEVFDGLDAVGCENVIDLLHEIQDNVGSVFVITHNDTLKSFFDRELIASKKEGRTSVRLEG